ncbi:MAG: type II toxin-antitoxin system Phd/YefM family antitoxin [Elusimicrobiota bacterium]
MSIEIISETEARNKMAKVIQLVRDRGDTLFITKNGRAVATLISAEKYNYIMSELEDKLDENDEKLAKEINEARKQYKKGEYRTLEDILKTKK